jgi:hypothetical protein
MLANEAIGISHYTFRIVAQEYFEVAGLKLEGFSPSVASGARFWQGADEG